MTDHRFGTVAIIGRPNVGKSTLLNALVGERVSIVTPKPQTTRNRIVGIRTLPGAQLVFIDTPGIHASTSSLNRRLVRIAQEASDTADVLVLVTDASRGLMPEDRRLLAEVDRRRLVVAINKVDRVRKPRILPQIAEVAALSAGCPCVPISARTGAQLDVLLRELTERLPTGPPHFEPDAYTTASTRFLAQEMVREQVFLQTRDEIPYGTAAVVESFEERRPGLTYVRAVILVAREAHKGIVIGKGGERLRSIGQAARRTLEALLGGQVFLELFVRVEPNWPDRSDRLRELELT